MIRLATDNGIAPAPPTVEDRIARIEARIADIRQRGSFAARPEELARLRRQLAMLREATR